MVVSEQQGKQGPGGRRSSVTPNTRERRKRKSWLSEIGKGHSPASTRRMRDRDRRSGSNSRSPTDDGKRKGKRFDVDSLTFSGLETPDTKSTWSPSATPSQAKTFFGNEPPNLSLAGSDKTPSRSKRRQSIMIPTAFPAPDPVGFNQSDRRHDDDQDRIVVVATFDDRDAVPVHTPDRKKSRPSSHDDAGYHDNDDQFDMKDDGQQLASPSEFASAVTACSTIPAVAAVLTVRPGLSPAAPAVSAGTPTAPLDSAARSNGRPLMLNSPKGYWNDRIALENTSPRDSEDAEVCLGRHSSSRRNLRISASATNGSSPSPVSPCGSTHFRSAAIDRTRRAMGTKSLSPGRRGFVDSHGNVSGTDSLSTARRGTGGAFTLYPESMATNSFSPSSPSALASPFAAPRGGSPVYSLSPRRAGGGQRHTMTLSPGRDRLDFSPRRQLRGAFSQSPRSSCRAMPSSIYSLNQAAYPFSPSSWQSRSAMGGDSFGRGRFESNPRREFGAQQQQFGSIRSAGRQADPLSGNASQGLTGYDALFKAGRNRIGSSVSPVRGRQQITRETLSPRLAAPRRSRRALGSATTRTSASSLPSFVKIVVDSPKCTTSRASPYRLARTRTPGDVGVEIGLSAEFLSAAGTGAAGMMVADSRGMQCGTDRDGNGDSTTAVVGTESTTDGEEETQDQIQSCVTSPYSALTRPSPPSRQQSPYSQARTSTNSNLNPYMIELQNLEPCDSSFAHIQGHGGDEGDVGAQLPAPDGGGLNSPTVLEVQGAQSPTPGGMAPSPTVELEELLLLDLPKTTTFQKLHAPPSVRTEAILKVASCTGTMKELGAGEPGTARDRSSPASISGERGTRVLGRPKGVCLSTPTGDGGVSDLSLWITTRDDAETPGIGRNSFSPPAFSLESSTLSASVARSAGNRTGNGSGKQEPFFGESSPSTALTLPLSENDRRNDAEEQQKPVELFALPAEESHNEEEPDVEEDTPEGRVASGQGDSSSSTDAASDEQEHPSLAATGEGKTSESVPLLAAGDGLTFDGVLSRRKWTDSLTCAPATSGGSGGWEDFWRGITRALCGLFDFCRPPNAGRR